MRDFLIQLLSDKANEAIVTQVFKILLTMANSTGSIEDLLMAVNHLDRGKIASMKPILQNEIELLSHFSENMVTKGKATSSDDFSVGFLLSPYEKKNWQMIRQGDEENGIA